VKDGANEKRAGKTKEIAQRKPVGGFAEGGAGVTSRKYPYEPSATGKGKL